MGGMLFTTLDHDFDMVDQHFRCLSIMAKIIKLMVKFITKNERENGC